MKEQLNKRLDILKAEFESGQKALADLEAKVMDLRNTLARISGAILVLEEELGKEEADDRVKPAPNPRTRRIIKERP
jgi:predicted  nucleic acid-binding Zn-ribbon protein